MKNLKFIIFCLLILFSSIITAKAASFGITSSTNEISPNGTFSVSIGGDCIGRVDLTVSNGALSTNSIWVEEGYVNVQVTAGTSGIVTVTATPVLGFSDTDANLYNPGSRSVSVNVLTNTITIPNKPNNPTTIIQKSSDNNLSSITVNVGELSPAFDPNIVEYTLHLKADITKVTFGAVAHEKAQIEGIGEFTVKPGNNDFIIGVTAENGSKKTYTVHVNVDDTPQVYFNYKNEKIGMIRSSEGISIPEGFTMSEHLVENHTIFLFSKEKITLVYGINESGQKNFYVFDKEKNELQNKFIPLNINNRTLYVTDIEIKKDNLISNQIKINDIEINCSKLKNYKDNYCLLRVLKENGEVASYLYETTENTAQLYSEVNLECFNVKRNNQNIIIFILSGLSIFFSMIILFLLFQKKKGVFNEKVK